MKSAITIALASALITTAAIKAAPALAQQPGGTEANISRVWTGDLDLRSEAGRSKLELRLARAAREVCGTASDADVAGKNDVRKCRDEALARATDNQAALLAAASRGAVLAVTAQR
jgi:UrcA family protein